MMNPFDLVKNLKDIQGSMNQMREELKNISVTGSAGGNMVQVTMNGHFKMTAIKLDPICVDARDVGMLQDLIVAASHDAVEKVQEQVKEKAGPMLNNMGMGL